MRWLFLTFLILSLKSLFAESHGQHHPGTVQANDPDARIERIKTSYLQNVKPIFTKKCFDCHSNQTRYPWYHKMPGVRWYIDRDVREACMHTDMSKDYPFQSHATPLEDLEAIQKVVRKGTMPPLGYRLLHPGSMLTDEENQIILQWAEQSEQLLRTKLNENSTQH